jgi:microtubule-associated protein-like 1/2
MQAVLYPGDLLTGDSNGNIFVWGRGYNAVTKAIWAAHEGPVFGLCVTRDGCVVTGGGKDGRVVVYDAAYKRTGEEATLPRNWGAVRTISQGRRLKIFLITGFTFNSKVRQNCIVDFFMLNNKEPDPENLTQMSL